VPLGLLPSFVPFQPHFLFRGGHAQTLAGHLQGRLPGRAPRRPGLRTEKLIIPCDDESGDRLLFYVERYHRSASVPAVVLVHGLEGDAHSGYILILARKLLAAGFHVLRLNMRTCGDGLHIARNAYNAGLTLDLQTILVFARKFLSERVAVVGFSLGANVVLKYFGEDQEERNRQREFLRTPPQKGAIRDRLAETFVAVSPPLDLRSSCHKIDSSTMGIYRMNFIAEMKRSILEKNYTLPFDPEKELPEIRTIFDMDHSFTAPMAGFRTALEYYATASARRYVEKIETPGLVLHAEDDPMISMEGWQNVNWQKVPHIQSVLTREGGHLGWYAKKHPLFRDRRWMDYMVVNYLMEWRDRKGYGPAHPDLRSLSFRVA